MRGRFIKKVSFSQTKIWGKFGQAKTPANFNLEITARCNNYCRHCDVAIPKNDRPSERNELSLKQIIKIADQALALGVFRCTLTGGEPLLRKDFFEIFLALKKKGLLVSLFTNATLIGSEHIRFFKKYPPRNIEVTVYGISRNTYEKVTRRRGSFAEFKHGLGLLLKNKIPVQLKAMVMRSNVQELPQICRFCRKYSKGFFRFDPFLNLRLDQDPKKNIDIIRERLSPDEIVAVEQADWQRRLALRKNRNRLINSGPSPHNDNRIFRCDAGSWDCYISYDGFFRLCQSLCLAGCSYDLKKGTLADAWNKFVPRVINMRSNKKEFLEKCRKCKLINLCMWCPARAYLETKELDKPVEYFCQIAHRRADKLRS